MYWTSSSSGSIEGTSESAADSSDDEIISAIDISSFSPVEHKSLISFIGYLVEFLSWVKRTIVSK